MSAAIVTGAARRLGRHLALDLARRGFDIVLHYHRSAADARTAKREIERLGRRCRLVEADLGAPRAAEQVLARGLELDAHLAVNLRAPYALTAAFARHVDRGLVVNLLDARIAGEDTRYFDYSLSRAALAAFTRLAALRLAPGIRVNAVAPGPILAPVGAPPEALERVAATSPLARAGTPEAIARAVRHFIDNDYVTGDIQFVDGGQHLRTWT